jgi:signal transduction histidine kinase
MDLQGTIVRPHRPEITARLTRTIDDLQTTIDEIRTRIFALQRPAHCGGGFQLGYGTRCRS